MENNFLKSLGGDFKIWSETHKVGKIPEGVAKEGAGENRVPFAHLANSVPVYLTLAHRLLAENGKKIKILDVGCGTGRNISFVKDRVSKKGFKYYGVDYSKSCINYAKVQYAGFGVRFKVHNGKQIPFFDDSFDYIVSSHVLEHIPVEDVSTYFSEISRILKKDGMAIIGTPNKKYCQDLFHKNPSDKPELRLILPHLHEYYYLELKKLLRDGKWFSKFNIDQTKNIVNRELMVKSINQIKPKKNILGKMIFLTYGILRKNKKLQDLMARSGTELMLKLIGGSYEDLLNKTVYIKDNKLASGDNFIIIAKK